jgi:hypothetical protein
MTLGIATHSIMTLSNLTRCIITFRITTGSVKHNMLSVIILNAAMVSVVAPLKWVLKSYFLQNCFGAVTYVQITVQGILKGEVSLYS